MCAPKVFPSPVALGRNWQRVHRFVYLIAVFGVLHFWWLVKRDVTEPALFAVVLGGLLGARLRPWWRMLSPAGLCSRLTSRRARA